MSRPLAALICVFLSGSLLSACGEDPATRGADLKLAEGDLSEAEKGQVVARVGDAVITLQQFEDRLNQQSPFARARYDSPQRKREFLDGLVRFELLAAEAAKRGYDKDPDVQLARKQALVRAFTTGELRDLVALSDITDDDIKAYYDSNPDEFKRPAQVRLAHLVLPDEERARALLAEVKGYIEADRLKAREIFAEFVRRHATDERARIDGGDVGFVGEPGVSKTANQDKVPPAVATAAFALGAVGELVAEPVKSSKGWHLVQKTGFRRPYARSLADARTSIRNNLFRARKGEAMEKFVTDLRAKATIEIDEKMLEKAEAKRAAGPRGIAPPIAPPGMGGPGGLGGPGGPRALPQRPRVPGLPPPPARPQRRAPPPRPNLPPRPAQPAPGGAQ